MRTVSTQPSISSGSVASYFSLIKSDGTLSNDSFMNGNRPCNMFPFGFFVDVLVIDPSVSVTGHFPILLLSQGVADDRIPFQRHAHGKDRDGNFASGKETVESPKACAGAIVVQRFHVEVTFVFCKKRREG